MEVSAVAYDLINMSFLIESRACIGDEAVRRVQIGSWQCQGWDMWHTPEYVCSHPDACCTTQSWLFCIHGPFHSGSTASLVHPEPREDSPLLEWLMLNDRQTLIKAAPGRPPVTVWRGQRGDDKWKDKSSMPGLDLGQGSRIRQHGWTLLASPQTIHSPQWTSTIARLSHLSL